MMKLSDKIVALRKSKGMSQEELAEKLDVSRQAVSRWEVGSAKPDATNIVQISKLFCVTTDYLLHDAYETDEDLPKPMERKENHVNQILIYLVLIEAMILVIQFMATFILQNAFFAFLSFVLFLTPIGGFEYAYRKKGGGDKVMLFRKRFYKISAWLGLYFPIRFLMTMGSTFFSWHLPTLVFECMVLSIYLSVSTVINLSIDKDYISKRK